MKEWSHLTVKSPTLNTERIRWPICKWKDDQYIQTVILKIDTKWRSSSQFPSGISRIRNSYGIGFPGQTTKQRESRQALSGIAVPLPCKLLVVWLWVSMRLYVQRDITALWDRICFILKLYFEKCKCFTFKSQWQTWINHSLLFSPDLYADFEHVCPHAHIHTHMYCLLHANQDLCTYTSYKYVAYVHMA